MKITPKSIEDSISNIVTAVDLVDNSLSKRESAALNAFYNAVTDGLLAAGTADTDEPIVRKSIIDRATQLHPEGAKLAQRVVLTTNMIGLNNNSGQKKQ